jgi:hypothetical protein
LSYTREELEEAGLGDFRVFLREVWAHLGLPKPTPVQYDMAYELQHGDQRLVIEAFRGVGKSWITAAYVLWTLLMNPQAKVLVVSANQKLADNFSIFCKKLINEMPLLRHLDTSSSDRNSNLAWDVAVATPDPAPSCKSAGLTGQITGSRADLIVADDVEIPKNSYTHVLREKTSELVKEFDAILKPGGKVRYLGTPQIEDSLYNKLPARGYTIKVWPVEVPENPDIYKGRLGKIITRMIDRGDAPDTPVEPTRFDEEEIAKRLAAYGRAGFALQYMLDTNPSDADKHPLKCRDLIVTDVGEEMTPVRMEWGKAKEMVLEAVHSGGFDGDWYYRPAWASQERVKFQGTVIAIDPSGLGKDETAYAIVRLCMGTLYLVASGGFKDGYSDATLKGLAAVAARHKVTDVLLEENYGGGMFTKLLKPHLVRACASARFAEDVWHSQQKEMFICDTLEPIIQGHRLVVDTRVIEQDVKQQEEDPQYSLIWQMTRMHRAKGALPHEDRLEALAMACQFWQERLDTDSEKLLEKHKASLQDEELRRFMKSAITPLTQQQAGGPPTYRYAGNRRN